MMPTHSLAQTRAVHNVKVTLGNFVRAETDTYFGKMVAAGGLGRFDHKRELTPIDAQAVVRSNRDTLYSTGVFDLDAGPVTVTMPDAGGRFMSLLAIDQDHYVLGTCYDAGPHVFARNGAGTRYIFLLVRAFIDPEDPADVAAVHALQDAIRVSQISPGRFEVPRWSPESLAETRGIVNRLPGFDPSRAFGAREAVDPACHLIGAARGWGGNPARDATYVSGRPAQNDGVIVHRLTVRDVPVDGFWSITVYNRDGYFEPNAQHAWSLNNVTARADLHGGYTIQFGGCDDNVPNCLPIVPGWNYTVRLYRPRPEILDGSWQFPEAQPVN
jgi:hypothetical protein